MSECKCERKRKRECGWVGARARVSFRVAERDCPCECASVRVCECANVFVCVYVCVCECVRMCANVCVRVRLYPWVSVSVSADLQVGVISSVATQGGGCVAHERLDLLMSYV